MKNDLRRFDALQNFDERSICVERPDLHADRSGMGCHGTAQASHGKTGRRQSLAEHGSEFAGGMIGDATHGINRFVGGTAGDESGGNGHGVR